ncbi:MAG: hypothetical protein LBU58_04125 [Clostridiales bacterium]|jgi:hypothetical protein|nr:hypothetical protein [Clostridiales bacterium]
MYVLQSDRLRVDVSEPGAAPNVTTRFDRAGFVEEVVLDGLHRFCASEPHNHGRTSGGRGICNEYVCRTYDDAAVGGYFPKPGVGLLLKEKDEPYSFMNPYKARPFRISVSHSPNALLFVTEPETCIGYALRQEKRLEVNGNRLEMRVTLQNVGERDFEAEEYCHNFLTVNGMAIDPDYKLTIPSITDRGHDAVVGALMGNGKGFTFAGASRKAMFLAVPGEEFELAPGHAFEWRLENTGEGLRVCGRDQINLSRVSFWAIDHMISIESFHKLRLAPGECGSWTRVWTFDAE